MATPTFLKSLFQNKKRVSPIGRGRTWKMRVHTWIHIIIIIIGWRFKVLRKHFVGWRRLSPLNFKNNFENLTFWITNLCRLFVLNMRNFYKIYICNDKFIKLICFKNIILKTKNSLWEDFFQINRTNFWNMIAWSQL